MVMRHVITIVQDYKISKLKLLVSPFRYIFPNKEEYVRVSYFM